MQPTTDVTPPEVVVFGEAVAAVGVVAAEADLEASVVEAQEAVGLPVAGKCC